MLTVVQDPTDRYAPFLEDVRRDGEARAPRYGIARLVHFLFLELVMHVLMLMVRMAKRAQEGKLPEVAPVAGKEASPPVVGVQPRCERFEQPEVGEPIAEAPCEMPVVEQTAGLAPARPWHAENDRWPPWHELGIVWTLEVGFWGALFAEISFRRRGYVRPFRYDFPNNNNETFQTAPRPIQATVTPFGKCNACG